MEWAPGAKGISIFGDFNGWNRNEFWLQRNVIFRQWLLILRNKSLVEWQMVNFCHP